MTTKRVSKILLGFIVASGMMLTSCSKDTDNGSEVDNGSTESGYFAMKIKTGELTKSTPDTEEGTADEQEVKAIRVVLYDKSTDKVAYSWDFSMTKNPTSEGLDLFEKTTTNYVTIAQEVKKKPYNLLVIVNPIDEVITATEVGQYYSLYTAAQTHNVSDLTGTTGAWSFMMSNFTGLVDVAVSDIKDARSDAHDAPVAVSVERAVAKITVTVAGELSKAPAAYTVEFQGWAADITNKKTFWTRKQALTVDNETEKVHYDNNGSYDRRVMYAIDPNYQGFHPYIPTPDFSTNPEFNYVLAANVTNVAGASEYVLENTMAAEEQWTDVTTRIVIKAKYSPAYSSIDQEELIAEDEPYYVYNNSFIFTPDQIQKIYAGNYAGWAAIVAVNPALASLQAFLQDNDTEFDDDYVLTDPTKSIKFGALQYNANGVNYYAVPIRHFDNGIQPVLMAYGRYGVVRNNIYQIAVNSISGPGSVVIPGGPEDPGTDGPTPDDNAGFVSVDIKVLEWYLRSQVADL